ncbi:MAG TPA: hypothetical protein VL551_14135 [Actinospica sp.]|jgi:hypothetical protein|nr:hypothetical protein [Actinospica sp.]
MGSQALGSPAEAANSIGSSAPASTDRGPARPRPWIVVALFAGAWIVPVLTHVTKTDPLLVLLIVFGTGGLVRVGSTVVDRLFVTIGLLIGAAIVGGLLFSLWPFGLQPIALAGVALTLLVAAYVWFAAPPPWRTWPRRMLGSDVVLLLGLIAGFLVAYWPSWSTVAGSKLGYAGMTGDRLRHFSLFDAIHRYGGYTFLMQGKVKNVVDPGVLAVYPPGQHYLYALADIFLRSNVNPGNAAGEMERYQVWVSLGYGFMIATVAWAARWVAGPMLKGWRRVFLTSAIAAYLFAGAFTEAVWSTWDPQVVSMAQIAILAAICFRPPRDWRWHAALMALLFIAVCLTYELYAPFAAILIAVSLFGYRKRLLPHWKALLVVTVLAIPAAASEYIAAKDAGLNATSAVQATGFTIPLSWLVMTMLGAFGLLGFLTRSARRRPSAVVGLIAGALSTLAVLAMMAYMFHTVGAVSYYYWKVVEAWAVIVMVGAGSFGHLLPRPRLAVSGWKGFGVGVCAFLLAVGVTRSFWWSTVLNKIPTAANAANSATLWQPGTGATWASTWMADRIAPDNIAVLGALEHQHLLISDVPTVTLIYTDPLSNVNMTLQLAVLNQRAGTMSSIIYGSATDTNRGLNSSDHLVCAGQNGAAWTAQQTKNLSEFEAGLKAVGEPVRVVVATRQLQDKLEQWGSQNPGTIHDVVYLSEFPPVC